VIRDGGNEVALAHPRTTGNAKLTGKSLELGELQASEAAAL
jgi:hypothetical protein